jgi:hypothetical protein
MKKILTVWIAAMAIAFALATTAYAQDSQDGYRNEAGALQGQVNNGTPSGAVNAEGGSLPFTGLDIALLLAAGGGLVGVGLGMRRLTRGPESA